MQSIDSDVTVAILSVGSASPPTTNKRKHDCVLDVPSPLEPMSAIEIFCRIHSERLLREGSFAKPILNRLMNAHVKNVWWSLSVEERKFYQDIEDQVRTICEQDLKRYRQQVEIVKRIRASERV